MGLLDFLRQKKTTAETAKNRLQIIIAQERSSQGAPDYLPLMRREILEVIRKYVNVNVDAVKVDVVKVEFGDSHSSALLSLPGDDTFKYVIMPMRI